MNMITEESTQTVHLRHILSWLGGDWVVLITAPLVGAVIGKYLMPYEAGKLLWLTLGALVVATGLLYGTQRWKASRHQDVTKITFRLWVLLCLDGLVFGTIFALAHKYF